MKLIFTLKEKLKATWKWACLFCFRDFFFVFTVKELLLTYPSIIQDRWREENLVIIATVEEGR